MRIYKSNTSVVEIFKRMQTMLFHIQTLNTTDIKKKCSYGNLFVAHTVINKIRFMDECVYIIIHSVYYTHMDKSAGTKRILEINTYCWRML